MSAIEAKIRGWDGERLLIQHHAVVDAWIVVAIHSSVLGPATGGTRLRSYPDLDAVIEDALRLSEGMTYKYAVAGFPRGGGKAVLACRTDLPAADRSVLLRSYGLLLRDLGGQFQTGPDVGTSSEDMDIIAQTGAPYVFSRTPAAGGAGSSGPYTALGVLAGIEVACQHVFGDSSLRGRSVLIQGLGGVGAPLAKHLLEADAVVMVSDPRPDARAAFGRAPDIRVVEPQDVYSTPCDVFSPCALGGILSHDTVLHLACRIVAGGANNQLRSADVAEHLAARGILYIPDFVLNIGGAMAITGIEAMGWSQQEAATRVRDSVRMSLRDVLSVVTDQGVLPDHAARQVAEARLEARRARIETNA